MRFTEFLVEGAPAAWMLTDPEEVRKWLIRYEFYNENVHIGPDGTVSGAEIYLDKHKLKFVNGGLVIPVNFDNCTFFNAQKCRLSTLKGAPRIVQKSCYLQDNLIKDLDGIPEEVHQHLNISENPGITSLEGIHKKLKLVGGTITIPITVKSHVLGLLMIKNLQQVIVSSTSTTSISKGLKASVNTLNKHLKGDRDVLECQEEMIEAGLKEFAKS